MNRGIKIGAFWALLFSSGCSRQPNDIFKAVFKEVPVSVQMLHGQDQYLTDCCLWLHFRIAKADLKKLMGSDYRPEPADFGKWKGVAPKGIEWWKPELLGDSALYYTKDSGKELEAMYINVGMTEVYYVNYNK
jgi:hypothetical protein